MRGDAGARTGQSFAVAVCERERRQQAPWHSQRTAPKHMSGPFPDLNVQVTVLIDGEPVYPGTAHFAIGWGHKPRDALI